jgi:hypothetical protein
MAADRVQTTMRFRRGTFRSMGEVARLLGGLSREDVMQLLLLRGLAATYRELGIEHDPAATAAELLAALARTWGADLSDDEAAAFDLVQAALARIVQVRDREAEGGPV